MGDNRALELAPHNAICDTMAADMRCVGVCPEENYWNLPKLVNNPYERHTETEHQSAHPTHSTHSTHSTHMHTHTHAQAHAQMKGKEGKEGEGGKEGNVFRLLDPKLWQPVAVPFRMAAPLHGGRGGDGGGEGGGGWEGAGAMADANPFVVPKPYAEAMQARLRRMADVRKTIGSW